MAWVVLDTHVASLSYQGRLPEPMAPARVGHTPCVTFVTVAEMARWAGKRQWGIRQRTQLVDWLARQPVLPQAAEVAWRWGALVAAAERRGRPRTGQ
jgi:predicted nucleic acid-binding protein